MAKWIPPNVKFEVDDVESPWLYKKPFDFIFSRYMAATIQDWPKLAKNVYESVLPATHPLPWKCSQLNVLLQQPSPRRVVRVPRL